ncbi:MAG: TraR/DksA family transcriptional regulator [Candidatus Makaraimicrobium thalassicum]|nr:MAG: TraR/DksA family transcriptional regulator [Candidatus Omnitrophota bacterium]
MVKKRSPGKKDMPFTKQELKTIRKELIEKKAQIIQELISLKDEGLNKSFKDASGDLSGYSFHMADMATDLYDREFSLGLAEAERERLFSLDEALKRVDEGTYGSCDFCGAHISKQRLKAMPQAGHCIKCQEKEEKSAGK